MSSDVFVLYRIGGLGGVSYSHHRKSRTAKHMTKPNARRFLVLGLCALAVACTIALVFWQRWGEPTYQGRSLNYHFEKMVEVAIISGAASGGILRSRRICRTLSR